MAVDPKQKLEALNSELKQIVDNYNQANSWIAFVNTATISLVSKA